MKYVVYSFLILLAGISVSEGRSAQVAFPDGADKGAFVKNEIKGKGFLEVSSGKFTIGDNKVKWTKGVTKGTSKSNRKNIFDDDKSYTNTKKQDYTVKITIKDGGSYTGEYRSEAKVETETIKSSKRSTTTASNVKSSTLKGVITGDNASYDLSVDLTEESKKGTLKGDKINFDIEAVDKIDGAAFSFFGQLTGFYVYDKGTLVAVVDVMNDGAFYILKDVKKENSDVLFALAAGLLRFNDMSK